MNAVLSVLIFILTYGLIVSERVNKTVAAVLGASLVLLFRLIPPEAAFSAIDWNVLFLLVGMMTSVSILARTGFFEWTAISVAKMARGNALGILLLLVALTAGLSAVLDNVTTIVLLVPVTILIMQLLDLNPAPFIILEAIASNIGGTSTLIGDPPNIIIGSQAGFTFKDFLVHLAPASLLVMVVFVGTLFLHYRKSLHVTEQVKSRVAEAIPHLAIIDRPNMNRALIILGLMFLGFFFHESLQVPPGIIALAGSMVMLLVCRFSPDEILRYVEWEVIFFFVGLFMLIASLEYNGVTEALGNMIIHAAGHNLFMISLAILWGSAVLSAVLDNIPFVITMIPLIKHFVEHFAGLMGLADPQVVQHTVAQPLFWALALGACLGGNGTLIGASANVVMAKIGEKNHCPVTFKLFFKYGLFFMVQSMVVCSLYIWLRYFPPW